MSKPKSDRVHLLFEGMTFESSYRILEEGKDADKLKEIGEKIGMELPSPDLAIFEGLYAMIDIENKNKCTLPREEVEKALTTLKFKAVDIDHFRKNTVGFWIDSKIDGDNIISYGAFWKANHIEKYEEFQKKMKTAGGVAISFEAWGTREFTEGSEDGSYNLVDIHFAGGALLDETEPAFPGAEVLEFAKNNKKERVLEFAKIIDDKELNKGVQKEIKKETKDIKDLEHLEESRFHIFDTELIMRNLAEMDCPSCEEKGSHDVLMVDFVKNITKTKCLNCGGESLVNMTPQPKLTKKGRQIKAITDLAYTGKIEDVKKYIDEFQGPDVALENLLEQSIERPIKLTPEKRNELTDEEFAVVATIDKRKIRIIPIHNLAHINLASARLDETQVIDLIDKLGANTDKVKRKILRKATYLTMKELLEKYQKGTIEEVIQEIAKVLIGRELTKAEMHITHNLFDYKRSTDATDVKNNTSLTEIPEEKSEGNPTSLQNAMIEEQIKASIKEAIRKEDKTVDSKKDTEIATLTVKLEESDKKLKEAVETLEDVKGKLTKFEEEKAEREKVEKEATIKARKEELGEEATKDMSDEDILDDMKFKLAKLEKENADLKAGKKVPEKASADLTVGSGDQETGAKGARAKVDEIFQASLDKDNEEYTSK